MQLGERDLAGELRPWPEDSAGPVGRDAGRAAGGVSRRARRDDPALGVERRLPPGRLQLGARDLVAGVVARADERAGFDVLEAERERLDLHLGELVGVVVALERQVLERRAQVLADRQDVDVDLAQRLERLGQLVARLAEPDHQARLGVDRVADLGGHLLGPPRTYRLRSQRARLRTGFWSRRTVSRLWLRMSGPRVHDGPQPVVGPVEVGDEDLDAHARAGVAHAA